MTAMARPTAFEKLRERFRIHAELVAVSGLRVGAGKSVDAVATNQPVLRDALGRPYIPGSSLKGSLRSALESILRALGRDDLRACELFVEGKRCLGDSKEDQRRKKYRQPIPLDEVLERSCTACGLFGSPYLAGRVFVHDLPHLAGAATEVRDGVGIHRDLGTAQPKIKYDVEVVPAGSRFELEMVLENVGEIPRALVLQTLELLHQGEILIGGLTSRGLGKVRLEQRKIERTTASRLLAGQGYEALDYESELKDASRRLLELLDGQEADDA